MPDPDSTAPVIAPPNGLVRCPVPLPLFPQSCFTPEKTMGPGD